MDLKKLKKRYRVNSDKINMPDYDLGTYIDGFEGKKRIFIWLFVVYNIIPFAGNIIFIIYLLWYWTQRKWGRFDRYLFFQKGILIQNFGWFGKIKDENFYGYSDFIGFNAPRTEHIKYVNGIRAPKSYSICLSFYETPYEDYFIFEKKYKPAKDFANFIPYIIGENWYPIIAKNYAEEFKKNHTVKFYSDGTEIILAHGVISIAGKKISNLSSYNFYDGKLYLWEDGDSEPIVISINDMINQQIFLLYVNSLLGIQ